MKAKASGNVSQTARELGISNKSLHAWIKDYGEPLDVNSASEKDLAAWARQLELQLAMREGQIEVLKKLYLRWLRSGSSAKPTRTVRDDSVIDQGRTERRSGV